MRIPTRSQHQAMDWSLALASQGIEPIIDRAEDGGWGLVVSRNDYGASLRTLRQYRLENHRWPWRREVARGGVLFDWGSAAWVALVLVFYAVQQQANLQASGMMDSEAVANGQWWRLFTAVWLHADVAHLAGNCTLGLVLLGLAMGRCGTGVGLLAAYLGGAMGNLAGWLLASDGPHRSLGASGMVMAALGLLGAQSWQLWRQVSGKTKLAVGGVLATVMLFVLVGASPHSDVIAHAGGFAGGALLGAGLAAIPKTVDLTWAQLLAGLVFTALTIGPWVALVLHAGARLQ